MELKAEDLKKINAAFKDKEMGVYKKEDSDEVPGNHQTDVPHKTHKGGGK
jgi:hypothetical protein